MAAVDSNNSDSFIHVARRVYQSFSVIITKNMLSIILIGVLPRLQAYIIHTEKIGNWTATFFENHSSPSAQALQIVLVLLQYILIAAVYYGIAKPNSSFIASVIACIKKTHKIIIVTIFYFLIVSVGLLALVLPGIYVMVLYSLTFISVITTNLSIIGAFKNSAFLVKGDWVFSFFSIITIMCIPSLMFGFIGYKCSSYTTSIIFNELFIIFANMVSIVTMLSGTLFLYKELMARKKLAARKKKEES